MYDTYSYIMLYLDGVIKPKIYWIPEKPTQTSSESSLQQIFSVCPDPTMQDFNARSLMIQRKTTIVCIELSCEFVNDWWPRNHWFPLHQLK